MSPGEMEMEVQAWGPQAYMVLEAGGLNPGLASL